MKAKRCSQFWTERLICITEKVGQKTSSRFTQEMSSSPRSAANTPPTRAVRHASWLLRERAAFENDAQPRVRERTRGHAAAHRSTRTIRPFRRHDNQDATNSEGIRHVSLVSNPLVPDETTSHSTRLSKDSFQYPLEGCDSQVAGYSRIGRPGGCLLRLDSFGRR